MSRYGRNQVPEPFSAMEKIHHYQGAALREVDHSPPIPVLDQEDLFAQDIDTSTIIKGARRVDALGSCVFNAATAALAAALPPARVAEVGISNDPAADEIFAICLYHAVSMRTGQTSAEWPPTDCGSSGLQVCDYLEQQGIISRSEVAHTPEGILSLMQTGPVLVGQPFLNDWETPDSNGFIDGDGSAATVRQQMADGVAGGHETLWEAIEHIAYTGTGAIDPTQTIIRMRNSWSTSWGQQGRAYLHLSTFTTYLSHYCDYRQIIA